MALLAIILGLVAGCRGADPAATPRPVTVTPENYPPAIFDLADQTIVSPNLGFLVNIGGSRLLHLGDAEGTLSDYQPYQLPGKEIDVAIVTQYQLLAAPNTVLEGVQAQYIVPMHFPPGDTVSLYDFIEASYTQSVLFRKEMQSWIVPH
jgi:hypothetical protein